MSRPVEAIQKDYAQISYQAGQLGYQIQLMQEQLETAYTQMRALNREASKNPQSAPAPEVLPADAQGEANVEPQIVEPAS